ncbi:MAG: response regulator transcription factor [Cyanobacteria bacterium J06628_4]
MSRILIVEDSLRVAAFLEKGLRANGYTPTIVDNGNDAISTALSDQFDLMILDLGLPKIDGLTVLDALRRQGIAIAIIILSARHAVNDKVAGFERGADDYLTKPFRFEELLMRIRVRLRDARKTQADMSTASYLVDFRGVELDLRSRDARVDGQMVKLSAREFLLAETFLRHPGQILSREQLLDHVWGYDYDPGSNVVDVYVGYLRKKLGHHLIETVRGMGYRLKHE